jgi:hypothetical protein
VFFNKASNDFFYFQFELLSVRKRRGRDEGDSEGNLLKELREGDI